MSIFLIALCLIAGGYWLWLLIKLIDREYQPKRSIVAIAFILLIIHFFGLAIDFIKEAQ